MSEGDEIFYLSVDIMPNEVLCIYLKVTMDLMESALARRDSNRYLYRRKRFYKALNQVLSRIRKFPVNFLVYLINNVTEVSITSKMLGDMAEKEIHRRSLLSISTANIKGKFDPYNFGFPRKPTF